MFGTKSRNASHMLFISAVIITIMTVINQTTVWSRHRIITYVYVTATMMIILMTLVMLIYQQRKHRKRNIKGECSGQYSISI